MRPQYGDVFSFDRLLRVFFYTSNADKLIQARLIFARHGYQLHHYRSQNEPYDEDYSAGTSGLLTKALQQVSQDFERRSVFFVEDTSLRIEVLSDADDYPGVRAKEWFAESTFEDVDSQLKMRGSDRRATVKSDIALWLPTLSRPIFFHGETSGVIAEDAPKFEASAQYPWLTPDTFNGWLIPDGANKRLGEMEFEDSLSYDFRAKSLSLLIGNLEELNAALNLTQRHYYVRRLAESENSPRIQLSLLPRDRTEVLIVVGHKCAGKSTLSDFLVGQRTGVLHLEGSTILRRIAAEHDVSINNSQEVVDFVNIHGWDIVAKRASEIISREGAELNIITGMRTVEELLWLRSTFPDSRIVLVEADQRTRFERHIRRARPEDVNTFHDFLRMDEEQMSFGAVRVGHEVADIVIRNDGDLQPYFRKIEEITGQATLPERQSSPTELHRSLRALRQIGRAATCDEIALVTSDQGSAVRRYNTNRALKAVPEFAQRVEKRSELLKYRLTGRSTALLKLLDLLAENAGRIALESVGATDASK
jgi:inosine/xanthosine triphosphate pyrophosphatase family protein/dephospho-CoA kinase